MTHKTKYIIQSESQHKQMYKKPINSPSNFPKQISYTLLPWLLIILSLTIVAPSLVAIVTSSCGQGELQIKFWEFEYQLNKKGDCSIPERYEK